MVPQKITIVGGNGVIGSFFYRCFASAGYNVNILEAQDWDQAGSIVSKADLVLLCVPLENMLSVAKNIAPHLSPKAILADVASIKVPVLEAMLEVHTGPVIGLHPMFGPGVTSLSSQKVVVCPGRDRKATQWLIDFIVQEGGKIVACSPEEHDQMMVTIQASRHFSTFGMGVFLSEEKIDIDRSLDFASPGYRIHLSMISRLFSQNSSLHVDIMLSSVEYRQAICRLARTYQRLSELIDREDRAALMSELSLVRRYFREIAPKTMEENNYEF